MSALMYFECILFCITLIKSQIIWDPGYNQLPVPLSDAVYGTIYGKKTYVIGGKINNTHFSDEIYVWDIDDTSPDWKVLSVTAPQKLYGSQVSVTVDNELIYIIGATVEDDTYGSFYIFNTSSENWMNESIIPAMSWQVIEPCIVTDNEYIYLVGGRDSSGEPVRYLQIYSISSNSWILWSTITYISNIHFSQSSCALYNNFIYIFGSYSYPAFNLLKNIYRYDIDNNRWDIDIAELSAFRFQTKALLLNDELIYIIGGLNGNGYPMNTTEIFNISSGLISNSTPLTINSGNLIVILVNNRIMTYGGTKIILNGGPYYNISQTIYLSSSEMSANILSLNPTINPTHSPSQPSSQPTYDPTLEPTINTISPTNNPSHTPSNYPTYYPSYYPSINPTHSPSRAPPPSSVKTTQQQSDGDEDPVIVSVWSVGLDLILIVIIIWLFIVTILIIIFCCKLKKQQTKKETSNNNDQENNEIAIKSNHNQVIELEQASKNEHEEPGTGPGAAAAGVEIGHLIDLNTADDLSGSHAPARKRNRSDSGKLYGALPVEQKQNVNIEEHIQNNNYKDPFGLIDDPQEKVRGGTMGADGEEDQDDMDNISKQISLRIDEQIELHKKNEDVDVDVNVDEEIIVIMDGNHDEKKENKNDKDEEMYKNEKKPKNETKHEHDNSAFNPFKNPKDKDKDKENENENNGNPFSDPFGVDPFNAI